MLKKEISDVLKYIIFFILFVLLQPVFLFITTIVSKAPYFDVFFPLFQLSLFFWALFMGGSLISFDQKQRGMEYLLSLPYSRLQLIALKILPRLVSVLFFYLAFAIMYSNGGENVAAFSFVSFTIIYFSVYLIALSFSASSDNFVVLFTLSAASLIFYFGLLILAYLCILVKNGLPISRKRIQYFFTGELDPFLPGILTAMIILLLPLLIPFFLSFRKFDIRPTRTYNKRYFKYFTPIFTVGLITSFLFVYAGADIGYKDYYLTQSQKLIEQHNLKIIVHETNRSHKIKGQFVPGFRPFLEENEFAYETTGDKLLRLNTSDRTVEILYESPPKKIGYILWWSIWKNEQTIAFLEETGKVPRDLQITLIDDTSKNISKIPIDKSFRKKVASPIIFGADETDGKRFWLICSFRPKFNPSLLRVWEDGAAEIIGESYLRPSYINRTLITYSENELTFRKEKDGKFEIIHNIPDSKGYRFGIGLPRKSLNKIQLKEIYGRKSGLQYARLDLKNFEIEEMGKLNGYLYCFYPDDYYLVERSQNRETVKIYEYKEGKSKLLKDFNFKLINRFSMYRSGIVLREGRKVMVYSLPDLRELKFKKL